MRCWPTTFTCFSLDGKAIDGCFGCRSSRWLRRRDTNGGNGGGPFLADAAPGWLVAECIFDAAVILVAVVGILAAIVVAVVAATYVSVLTVC